jgi:flavin prenyltransferase
MTGEGTPMKKIVVGITGASGSMYAVKLVKQLLKRGWFVHLICTENGRKVLNYETELDVDKWCEKLKAKYQCLSVESVDDLFSSVASGSYHVDAVVIIPCSMSTLGEIANGTGKNLLCRTADVALKEGRKLLLVPRETPLSTIHLENMLKLSRMGVGILPAMPAFYNRPETVTDMVNFIVGKTLDYLGVENDMYTRWED